MTHHVEELEGLEVLRTVNDWHRKAREHLADDPLMCAHIEVGREHGYWICLKHFEMGPCCKECHDHHVLLFHTRGADLGCAICDNGMLAGAERTWIFEDGPYVLRTEDKTERISIAEVTAWLPMCIPHLWFFEEESQTFGARYAQRN